jgi:hypothetical protein
VVQLSELPVFLCIPLCISDADWTIQRSGAILLEGTEGFVFDSNHVTKCDGNGLFLSNYNRNASILQNEFSWIGDNAMSAFGSMGTCLYQVGINSRTRSATAPNEKSRTHLRGRFPPLLLAELFRATRLRLRCGWSRWQPASVHSRRRQPSARSGHVSEAIWSLVPAFNGRDAPGIERIYEWASRCCRFQ